MFNCQWKKGKYHRINKCWDSMWLLAIFLFSNPILSAAADQCSYAPGFSVYISAPPAISVDPSVSIGTRIGVASGSWPLRSVSCSMAGYASIIGVGMPDGIIYPTSIPGVGYRARITSTWAAELTEYWPTTPFYGNFSTSGTFAGGTLNVEFIKTGPIPSAGGKFGPGKIGSEYISGQVSGDLIAYYLSSPIIINPVTNACTVTSSTITVPLEDVNQSSFRNVGSTAKATPFNVPLNCSSPVNLSLSFSGNMAGVGQGVFKNTNSANASNIGIQLLDKNNNPITTAAGQYISVGIVSGFMNYPMTAQYYALTTNIPPGSVSAIAYATIVYN